jgi:hypothetical protein
MIWSMFKHVFQAFSPLSKVAKSIFEDGIVYGMIRPVIILIHSNSLGETLSKARGRHDDGEK